MRNRSKQKPAKKSRAVARTTPRKRRTEANAETSYDRTERLTGSVGSSNVSPEKNSRVETVYDRIKYLSGVLHGPGDLLSNPESWENFGK